MKNRKPRILLLASHLFIGGAENVIAHLYKNLDRGKFDCFVLCLDQLGSIGQALNENGFPVEALPKPKSLKQNYLSSIGLLKYVVRNRIDVIHSHTTHTLMDSSICKIILPYVRVVHTFHYGNYPLLPKRELFYEKLFCRFPNFLVAVGIDQHQKLSSTFPDFQHKLKIVRNGIPFVKQVKSTNLSVKLSDDTVNIGTISTLIPQKGTAYLLDAAKILSRRHDNIKFFIAGDGPLRESLEKKAKQLGIDNIVEFLGWVDDASSQLLPSIDIFLLPSLWEAMPMVILEAMAHKVPIISSNVGESRHIIDDGKDGFLFMACNAEEMANKLSYLIDHPDVRTQFSERAYTKFINNFSLNYMIEGYQKLYQKLT